MYFSSSQSNSSEVKRKRKEEDDDDAEEYQQKQAGLLSSKREKVQKTAGELPAAYQAGWDKSEKKKEEDQPTLDSFDLANRKSDCLVPIVKRRPPKKAVPDEGGNQQEEEDTSPLFCETPAALSKGKFILHHPTSLSRFGGGQSFVTGHIHTPHFYT